MSTMRRWWLWSTCALLACGGDANQPVDGNGGSGGGGGATDVAGSAAGQTGAAGTTAAAGAAAGAPVGGGGSAGTTVAGAGGAMGGAGGARLDAGAERPPDAAAVGACGTPPAAGLKLWLSADEGVTLAAGMNVAAWKDRAGGTMTARQTSAAKQPQRADGVLNGHPVIRFAGEGLVPEIGKPADPNGDTLLLDYPVNGLDGMTIALVSASTQLWRSPANDWCGRVTEMGCSNTYNSPLHWEETGSWGMVYLSPNQQELSFRFGVGEHDTDADSKPVCIRAKPVGSAFSLTEAVHDGKSNRIYVSGDLVWTVPSPAGLTTIKNVATQATIGRGRNYAWKGDIAELLIYERALPDADRKQLEAYIGCRYFPAGPQVQAAACK